MRDINRLKHVHNVIKEVHSHYPDFRTMQFFIDFLQWHISEYGTDGFYIEDDDFIDRIRKFDRYLRKGGAE